MGLGAALVFPPPPIPFLSVGRSLQVWSPPGPVQKKKGVLHHPIPFILTHLRPRPAVCVSTCRKWATCFQKVIPDPAWAATLIRIYHPVKGKDRKSLVFRGLPRLWRAKDISSVASWETSFNASLTLLGHRESPVPGAFQLHNSDRRKPYSPAPHRFEIHRNMHDTCDSCKAESRGTEKGTYILHSTVGSPGSCFSC